MSRKATALYIHDANMAAGAGFRRANMAALLWRCFKETIVLQCGLQVVNQTTYAQWLVDGTNQGEPARLMDDATRLPLSKRFPCT